MRLPGFVTRFVAAYQAQTDVEKGTTATSSNTIIDGSRNTPTPMRRDRDARVQDLLFDFRHHVGIQNDNDLTYGRTVPNRGIYERVVKGEAKYAKSFKIYSALINSALGLQIVFAAALTALGAGNGPRSAVTAFGALNTIIAGFLTYLKGSGLPNRYKYYKDELTKVREYIESREREFSRGMVDVDLRSEVVAIEAMYNAVKRDIESNTPEAFISRTKQSGPSGPLDVDHIASRARSQYGDSMSYVDEKVHSVRPGLESRLSGFGQSIEARLRNETQGARNLADSRFRDVQSGFNDRVSSSQRYAAETRHGLESRLAQEKTGLDNRLSDIQTGLNSRLDDTRHGAEASYNQARSGAEDRVDYMRNATENSINQARLATAAQVEDTRHGLESRIEETRTGVATQVEETRHDLQTGMEEVQAQVKATEEKIMGIAENVAQKVLSVTQSRHQQEDRPK